MPLPDTMFCAQQIRIPPELPDILKQFTKDAIRTQPADVLQWSAGSLNTSMKHLCEILTTDPEGGPARIPFETFSYAYRYLSKMDSDVPEGDTESYLATLKDTVKV
ncbi:ropporin-1A isoform X1 [Prionailurus iriomotensis]